MQRDTTSRVPFLSTCRCTTALSFIGQGSKGKALLSPPSPHWNLTPVTSHGGFGFSQAASEHQLSVWTSTVSEGSIPELYSHSWKSIAGDSKDSSPVYYNGITQELQLETTFSLTLFFIVRGSGIIFLGSCWIFFLGFGYFSLSPSLWNKCLAITRNRKDLLICIGKCEFYHRDKTFCHVY